MKLGLYLSIVGYLANFLIVIGVFSLFIISDFFSVMGFSVEILNDYFLKVEGNRSAPRELCFLNVP